MSNVEHPKHYNQGTIETIDLIKGSLTEEEYKGFLKGNVLKYVCRASFKGNEKEDYEKAKWYLQRLINTKRQETFKTRNWDDLSLDNIKGTNGD